MENEINLETPLTNQNIKQDLYDLNYSEHFEIIGSQEADINLDLETTQIGTCAITGTVFDENNQVVPDCTIKLFDNDGKPFMHTVTNALGNYSFNNLNSGNYSITCVKNNIILTVAENVYLQEGDLNTHNFNVVLNSSINLCTIAGIISKSNDTNSIIEGATVRLLDSITRKTIATTLSANDGEYVFYDIVAGNYIIVATKQGYETSSDIVINAKNNSILNINIKLNINQSDNLGTISGIISHKNKFIANAFVGLYKIDENDKEILIATTKTNSIGAYMFGKVESGKYKVKAKLNNI